jgi:hypothetical protein
MANAKAPPPPPRAPQASQPSFSEGVLLAVGEIQATTRELQAGLAQTDSNVRALTESVAKITASWKDKAVTQIGAVAIAALGIISAVVATRPGSEPQATRIQRTELDIRAEGCAKMANGVPETYARCMVDQVVAPGANAVSGLKQH